MTSKLSHWQHGLISAGILLFVISAIYLVLIQPALSIKNVNREQIESLTFQLQKLSNAENKINQVKNEIKRLTETETNQSNFLEGNAPAIIAADLQKIIKTIVQANGGNLVSTHAITGKNDDSHPKVTIKVHMQVDMEALQAVLYNLTTHKPLLFTDNILIQRRTVSNKRKSNSSGLIEVRFDVTGYLNNTTT
ncbi:MAG: hypothetical protein HND53_00080 [Proteobacteria bacterium]|nr:hypothetical protein [Pseudomonadota bacterium]NOG58871.1 hypothetical protein [Pseudomonadota bacterium]